MLRAVHAFTLQTAWWYTPRMPSSVRLGRRMPGIASGSRCCVPRCIRSAVVHAVQRHAVDCTVRLSCRDNRNRTTCCCATATFQRAWGVAAARVVLRCGTRYANEYSTTPRVVLYTALGRAMTEAHVATLSHVLVAQHPTGTCRMISRNSAPRCLERRLHGLCSFRPFCTLVRDVLYTTRL